jgi:hypothetical protein
MSNHQGNAVAADYTGIRAPTVAQFHHNGALWKGTLSGSASGSRDQAFSVAVDSQGRVATVGSTENTNSGVVFTRDRRSLLCPRWRAGQEWIDRLGQHGSRRRFATSRSPWPITWPLDTASIE